MSVLNSEMNDQFNVSGKFLGEIKDMFNVPRRLLGGINHLSLGDY